ncbi:MAG TPA: response regulator [Vicinamibacterales bacterium]|nr:response regulator [Vicinamibacterales bacterium]
MSAHRVGEVAAAGRRALVVDDELLIRWSLRETLSDRGFTVAEAEDARGALRALAAPGTPPDLVLLDFRLPDSNDLTLLSRVIALVPGGRVILMTAYDTPELASAALERGAFTVLHKPFEMQDLIALID